jgi:hypothetical protein
MTEKAYSFGTKAIDELNEHPDNRRPTGKEFAFLMAGLVALLLLFYFQIVR